MSASTSATLRHPVDHEQAVEPRADDLHGRRSTVRTMITGDGCSHGLPPAITVVAGPVMDVDCVAMMNLGDPRISAGRAPIGADPPPHPARHTVQPCGYRRPDGPAFHMNTTASATEPTMNTASTRATSGNWSATATQLTSRIMSVAQIMVANVCDQVIPVPPG